MTGASLTDALVAARRDIPRYGEEGALTFNSLFLMPDELSDFMKVYDESLIGKLTKFYDVDPYTETRVTGSITRIIESSQLSMIAGSTPSHLLTKIPEYAWEQGFFSRTILVYAEERRLEDDIFAAELRDTGKLAHDLKCIFSLQGQFKLSDEFRAAVNDWRRKGELPRPGHPRFKNYCARRLGHVLKLSMVSSADRSDDLRLELRDWERALGWLHEAESTMPGIFGTATSIDAGVIDEALHYIGAGEVNSHRLTRWLSMKIPAFQVKTIIATMEDGGMISVTKVDKMGLKTYRRS